MSMSRYSSFRRRQEALSGVVLGAPVRHSLVALWRRMRGLSPHPIAAPPLALLYHVTGADHEQRAPRTA